ncbi:MAG: glycosyltransferase family 2 protein [Bryobacter sp.]
MSHKTVEPALELSVVVPTFNEAGNVLRLLDLLETALAGIAYEVIFVDDDSVDGTADLLLPVSRAHTNVRVLRRIGRRGLSSACLEGMLASSAPHIAVMDADLQHDERILPDMLRLAREQRLDVVVGSRNTEGGSMGEFSQSRVSLSQYGRRLSEFVCRTSVSDPMSGFFLVDRKFLEEVVYRVSGIGFKILVDLLASSARPVRLGEVPYTFRSRFAGESKLDILVLLEYVELLAHKLTGGLLPQRFLMFSLVGLFGFLVHINILSALEAWADRPYREAFLVATLIAMTVNFFLNNIITYRDSRFRGAKELAIGWSSFCVACSLGAIFALLVAESLQSSIGSWIGASLFGVALASVWNFGMTRLFTWGMLIRSRRRREAKRLVALTLNSPKAI